MRWKRLALEKVLAKEINTDVGEVKKAKAYKQKRVYMFL